MQKGKCLRLHRLGLKGASATTTATATRTAKKQELKINRATSLQVHHEFCAFLYRRCKTTTCFMKDVNTRKRFNFSFSELRYSLSTHTFGWKKNEKE